MCYLELGSRCLGHAADIYKKKKKRGRDCLQTGRQADSQLLPRQAAIGHAICRPSMQIHRVIIQQSGTVLQRPLACCHPPSPPPPPRVLISIIQRLTVRPGRKEGRDFFCSPLKEFSLFKKHLQMKACAL